MRYTLTLLEEQHAALREVLHHDSSEFATLLLCGKSRHIDPWTGEQELRLLVQKVVAVEATAFVERSPVHLTWSTTPFFKATKVADEQDLAIAVIHSHPSGHAEFSATDDVAERELFQVAADRQEAAWTHLSLIMDSKGALAGRVYEEDLKPRCLDGIRIVGDRWRFNFDKSSSPIIDTQLDRQIRTFGVEVSKALGALRIGVVGCGGTGSAVASLLARIGVGKVALFDPDSIDETSLGRLHFSTRTDANLGRLKVDVVGEGLARLGLRTSVRRCPYHVDDERCRDALLSCDVLFGCTDDHLGRNLLNRIVHFYLIPVIDLGLLIEPRVEGGFETFDGRVTVVQPEYPCQHCRGLIQPERMLAEDLRRRDPVLFQQRKRAGYIQDSDDPNPVVVTFTTELAAVAVNELFQRLTGFRGERGSVGERVRRFDQVKDADQVPGGIRRPECELCGRRSYDGRGDVVPFLDQA